MAAATVDTIAARLVEHGLPSDTPAALVENGTRVAQRVVVGTVATLTALAAANAGTGPALLIIGTTAALRAALGSAADAAAPEPATAMPAGLRRAAG